MSSKKFNLSKLDDFLYFHLHEALRYKMIMQIVLAQGLISYHNEWAGLLETLWNSYSSSAFYWNQLRRSCKILKKACNFKAILITLAAVFTVLQRPVPI